MQSEPSTKEFGLAFETAMQVDVRFVERPSQDMLEPIASKFPPDWQIRPPNLELSRVMVCRLTTRLYRDAEMEM